jgi:hypothetical protein
MDVSSPACFRGVYSTIPLSGTEAIVPENATVSIHMPWSIAWESVDRTKLSPTPPPLSCGQNIVIWVPGTTADTRENCEEHTPGIESYFYFIVVGIPLIVCGLVMICCYTAFFCYRRKKKRRNMTPIAIDPITITPIAIATTLPPSELYINRNA